MLVVGSAALSILQAVQLAILEPWLRDALALRTSQILTPSAPTELSVVTFVFMAVSFALLFLIGKIFFFGGMNIPSVWTQLQSSVGGTMSMASRPAIAAAGRDTPTRALVIADAVSQTLRREKSGTGYDRLIGQQSLNRNDGPITLAVASAGRGEALGDHLRLPESRRYRRASQAGNKRDTT